MLLMHDADEVHAESCRSSLTDRCIRPRFSGLEPIALFESVLTPSAFELARTLEALTHWSALLDLVERVTNGTCIRNETAVAMDPSLQQSPYACPGLSRNFLLSPVLGDAHGVTRAHTLLELHAQSRCLRALAAHEASRGVAYTHVVFSRLELQWLTPHLARERLPAIPHDCVWVPHGENYYGVNDRMRCHRAQPVCPHTATARMCESACVSPQATRSWCARQRPPISVGGTQSPLERCCTCVRTRTFSAVLKCGWGSCWRRVGCECVASPPLPSSAAAAGAC